MTAPEDLAMRAFCAAVERHRASAISEASDLQIVVDRIVEDLSGTGRASTGDGRRALHAAGMLMERLTALEVLRQDAEHLTLKNS